MSNNQFHFSISERKIYLRFLDAVFLIVGLYFYSVLFPYEYIDFSNPSLYLWLFILIIYYYFFGQVFELYNLKTASDRFLTLKSLFITILFTTLFYIFTPKISPVLPDRRLQIVYFSLTLFFMILINRFIYIQFIFSPRFLKNILIVGNEESVKKVFSRGQQNTSNHIVGYVSDKELEEYKSAQFTAVNDSNIRILVDTLKIDEILVCSDTDNNLCKSVNNQLIDLFEKGMSIRSIDSFMEEETMKISESQLISNFYNYFSFSKSHQNNLYLAFRRIFDIVVSLIGILFLALLIPLVAFINLFANKGKLLYFQTRVGKRGATFQIVKFRTMVANAEKNGAVWSSKNDHRITRFGKVMRKTRLDEIPQFINVLIGEMSLIGPRPERPEFVSQLENEIPYYSLRHVIKPGLTGWAQVMHPYASSVEDSKEKLLFDLYYIKERNLILDLKIVLKTISTVLFFRGT